jgi:ubiquinone/menaquinone biosynthesis C-methylase UbiE/DNA-binding MarR family transcriptional regulator
MQDGPTMTLNQLMFGLKAAGEPTRLRVLAVLDECELTVTELCRVLGQSQPRVSRHLRLMGDAGLLERRAEGTSAFYRPVLSGPGRTLVTALLPLVNRNDPALQRDLQRLAAVRGERAQAAADYFASVAAGWDKVRDLLVGDELVEQAMLAAVASKKIDALLDIGTGTGRILELFAGRIGSGLGIDLSREMLNVARSHLDDRGLNHCSVRHGTVYDLDVAHRSIDVAVLHHVLHFLDDPATAIAQAATTLHPDGTLLIVDFAPHRREVMRSDYAHRRLGFTDAEIVGWCEDAGLDSVSLSHLRHTSSSSEETLTVTLWAATQHQHAPRPHILEAAS